jgi:hypothetical protein
VLQFDGGHVITRGVFDRLVRPAGDEA